MNKRKTKIIKNQINPKQCEGQIHCQVSLRPYYQNDLVTLYCGDCRDILPSIEAADILLTSPPYNVNLKYDGYKDKLTAKDFEEFNREWVSRLKLKQNSRMYIVVSDKMLWWFKPMCEEYNFNFSQMLVWCKPNLAGGAGKISSDWNNMVEWILLFRNGKRTPMMNGQSNTHNYFEIAAPQSNFKRDKKLHVAQFPFELPKRIISRTPGDLILDPFAGSGQTLLASYLLKRKSIGIELVESNCEIIASRFESAKYENTDLWLSAS